MEPSLFFQGFITGAGLIIAIGPQNAFVLRQALQKNHVFTIALICSLIDAVLISLGVSGLGNVLSSNHTLLIASKYLGVLFLTGYGIRCFYFVFTKEVLLIDQSDKLSFKKTILTVLAFSLLNPHVYLDNCILLGSIGAQIPEIGRLSFTIGAISASFAWFFSLCYGARYLIPIFAKPLAWKILDFLIGCIMFTISFFISENSF